MKRLAVAAALTVTLAGPVILAAPAQAHGGCTHRTVMISDGRAVDVRRVYTGTWQLGRYDVHQYVTEKRFGKQVRWTRSRLLGAGVSTSCSTRAQ